MRRKLPPPRWPCFSPVLVQTDLMRGEGRLANLSESGVFVRSALAPRPGTSVRMEILDADDTIPIEGTIRWVGTLDGFAGFGVQLEQPARPYGALVQRMAAAQHGASADGTLA
jgi:hypothetical protein